MEKPFVVVFVLFISQCDSQSDCSYATITVDNIHVLSSDDYLSTRMNDFNICQFEVNSGGAAGSQEPSLLVSISTFSIFSHRRPKNTKKILVKSGGEQFLIGNEPKGYRLLKTPIYIDIPMNLNFRSILVFSQPVECSSTTSGLTTMRCPENPNCWNCSKLCFPVESECDGLDTCGEDESYCDKQQTRSPLTSYFYNRDVLSSSQYMLIGFFVLNGSFIGFFLILSLYSSGIFVGKCLIYAKNSNQSRHTFIKYLREAIPPVASGAQNLAGTSTPECSTSTETNMVPPQTAPIPRRSFLHRISFQPGAALKELEPEIEDRDDAPVNDSICSPPDYQPEVFLRRQSLPFGLTPHRPMAGSVEPTKRRFNSRAASLQH